MQFANDEELLLKYPYECKWLQVSQASTTQFWATFHFIKTPRSAKLHCWNI